MNIDFDKMSSEELQKLIKDAQKALKTFETRRRNEAKRAAEKAAREFGFTLDEVVGGTAKSTKGAKSSKGAPKYANPADRSQTWTGRGRKPKWVLEALASGKSVDDMAI